MPIQLFSSPEYIRSISETAFYSKLSADCPQDLYIFFEPELFEEELKEVLSNPDKIVILGCAKTGLMPLLDRLSIQDLAAKIIGLNEIPFFLRFHRIELSLYENEDRAFFEELLQAQQWDYFIVEDAPGFVSARVISMIINEACFMVSEQLTDFPNIDLAMKLGTNYPFGPSEWLHQIGIDYVYSILHALHQRNPSGRYKIAPLLQKLYFQHKIHKIKN